MLKPRDPVSLSPGIRSSVSSPDASPHSTLDSSSRSLVPANGADAGSVQEEKTPEQGSVRVRPRHWLPLLFLTLLVAATILPPLININRYHRRIADSISRAVGRPVHMADVRLVMLPRPGFELTDFVVEEDPAFGVEPILRSPTVVASVRLVSLWRGRLEIARIHLKEPSLNLARNSGGQWNFANVLLQASRIPNAPTAQKRPSGSLRFPYIEATEARINFKSGAEKRPFSFLNADLSIWLAQPDEWQVRFEAQPVRTDVDLSLADTGVVRIQGSLHRAPTLRQVPLQLTAQWTGGSLGQLSRMLTGYDPGWRGTLDLSAVLSGQPDDMLVVSQVLATGIHRAEFEPDTTAELNARCDMHYRHGLEAVKGLTCIMPAGDGQLLLTGAIHDVSSRPKPALALEIKRVPAAALLEGIRLMQHGFPASIRAVGDIDGRFTYDATGATPFAGQARAESLIVAADGLIRPLIFNGVSASASRDLAPLPTRRTRGRLARRPRRPLADARARGFQEGSSITISPLAIGLAGDPPLILNAQLDRAGFELHLSGSAPFSRLAALNRSLHLLPFSTGALGPTGAADLDLTIRGPWLLPLLSPAPNIAVSSPAVAALPGSAAPRIDGSLRLRNTRLTTSFLATPLDVVSAQGVFSGNNVRWEPLSINVGAVHADGSLVAPIPCASSEDCTRHFDLHVSAVDLAALQNTLLGARRGQIVQEILRTLERPQPWPRLEGTLHVDSLTFNNASADAVVLHNVSTSVKTEGNLLTITRLDVKALGGDLQVHGTVDASGRLPAYELQLKIAEADAGSAAAIFHEHWGSGTLDATAHFRLSGFTLGQLADSAAGTFHSDWTGHGPGGDRRDEDSTATFDRFDRWVANGSIANRRLSLEHSFLVPSAAKSGSLRGSAPQTTAATQVPLSGSITFARELSLRVGDGTGAEGVGGTLEHPTPSGVVEPTGTASVPTRRVR